MATVRVETADGTTDYPDAIYEESQSGYLRVLSEDDGRLLASYAHGAGVASYLPEARKAAKAEALVRVEKTAIEDAQPAKTKLKESGQL